MDLEWCDEEDLKNTVVFNGESIISLNSKKRENDSIKSSLGNILNSKNDKKAENCFDLNLEINNGKDLLEILNYLSIVSNHLRTNTRNKFTNITATTFEVSEYEDILKYLNWLKTTIELITKYFYSQKKKDLNIDINNIKPFKTSSYKFCNYKESCSIHKNKNKYCDKNHFVFDMIVIDIYKLIESINLIGYENVVWLYNNNYLVIKYDEETLEYSLTKISKNDTFTNETQINVFFTEKNTVLKCFDVISYVLNKMFEEAYTFLNYNIHSNQILIS
jgi:hypothetical protein